MLGNSSYNNKTLKLALSAFADVFNDLRIVRENNETILVPISWGAKEKFIQKYNQDARIDDTSPKVKMVLPRMSYGLSSISYDANRQLVRTKKTYKYNNLDNENAQSQIVHSPWVLGIQLSIITNSILDMFNILEQILPFFNPYYNISIKDNPLFQGNTDFSDIPLELTSVSPTFDYEGSFDDRRLLTCDLDFQMKINLYGAIKNAKIINEILINQVDNTTSTNTQKIQTVKITPDPDDALPTSDYGYNIEIE